MRSTPKVGGSDEARESKEEEISAAGPMVPSGSNYPSAPGPPQPSREAAAARRIIAQRNLPFSHMLSKTPLTPTPMPKEEKGAKHLKAQASVGAF